MPSQDITSLGKLPKRWHPALRPHRQQYKYWTSPHRFNMLPCGRRSGKTELFKRKIVKTALKGSVRFDSTRYFAAAPTRDQAKKIYWADLKALTPRWAISSISEGDLIIRLINAAEIHVVGMDKPERIEGQPWDGGGMDEYGNMKEKAWPENVRPALSDRQGWCDFLGVPEGENHYFDLYGRAKEALAERGAASPWGVFEWPSSDILSAEEIESARADLHPLMFEQEYGGKFVNFNGVALFDPDKMLVSGQPVELPAFCDTVFAVIDTAVKDGTKHDGTGCVYFAASKHVGSPLAVVGWELVQMEGALLESWLPTTFQRLEGLSVACHARFGSAGVWIEDKQTGSVLIQQSKHKGWPVQAIPSGLTALGKDARALSVSGHHYAGKCKISREAYDQITLFKGVSKNHFLSQITGFRIGDPEAARRADDLSDCYFYGLALTFGDDKGL